MNEIDYLRSSDARNISFTLAESLSRMIPGYEVLLIDYSTFQPIKVHISADGYGILLKRPFHLEKFYPYEHFSGVLLGSQSSTFVCFSQH